MGAIDRIDINLPTLSKTRSGCAFTALDQMRETLEFIAQDLRENCVVMDTALQRKL